jgi:3-carboxy-cis,cis-muconate cycloisomerase
VPEPTELLREGWQAGSPVIPLLAVLRGRLGAEGAHELHRGATSQDIIDTALVLQLRAAVPAILDDLQRAAAACARHARQHEGTAMAGRTWLQQATPVTFGLKAAGWLDAIARATRRLDASFRDGQVVQFGGASGTLAALGPDGPAVARALASRLQLGVAPLPWHAHRIRFVALATDMGIVCGTLGKVARDLSLLAQTEVEEAHDPPADAGGSSTMPHKRNPVRAALALAAATRAPGLVATMLSAMPQEHERGLGGWHAEWDTLPELVAVTAAAARATAAALDGLVVDPERMRHNLERLGGLVMAEAIAMRLAPELGRDKAQAATDAATRRAVAEDRLFADVLAEDPAIARVLDRQQIERTLRPDRYLGAARAFVNAVLADYERETRKAGS